MKEPIKDRIDVLIESARNGNTDSQLKLAKCFYKGHLVEKSIDNALYWSFKAASSGSTDAVRYYEAIVENKNIPSTKIAETITTYMSGIAFLELLIGAIIWLFVTVDETAYYFFMLLTITGAMSLLGVYISSKIFNHYTYQKSEAVTIIVIHLIGIYIAYNLFTA